MKQHQNSTFTDTALLIAEFLSGTNQKLIQEHCKIFDSEGRPVTNSWEERTAMNLLLCPEDGTVADTIKRAIEYTSIHESKSLLS